VSRLAHQAIDDHLSDEVMPVNSAIDDKGGCGDSGVASGGGEIAGEEGHFKSARDIEDIDLIKRDQFREAVKRASYDF